MYRGSLKPSSAYLVLLLLLCVSPSSGRLWDCMRSVLRRQDSVAEHGASVMQQADVAALWLLEALVLTLPQSLLQAYVVVSTDVGVISPGWIIGSVLFVAFHLIKTYLKRELIYFWSFHTSCSYHQWPIAVVCVCCLFPGPWCCTTEPAVWYDQATWPCLLQPCCASWCGGRACWVQGWLASCFLPGSLTGGSVE